MVVSHSKFELRDKTIASIYGDKEPETGADLLLAVADLETVGEDSTLRWSTKEKNRTKFTSYKVDGLTKN